MPQAPNNILIKPSNGFIAFDRSATGSSTVNTTSVSSVYFGYDGQGGITVRNYLSYVPELSTRPFTVVGNISSANVIFDRELDSRYWGSAYTTTNTYSSVWNAGGSSNTVVSQNSAKWDSTYTSVTENSANWDSV